MRALENLNKEHNKKIKVNIPISDIENIVNYLYWEEYNNYVNSDEKENHIFVSIKNVVNWLEKN